jgi:hypothetical protein
MVYEKSHIAIKRRKKDGSMLVLVGAIILGILLSILFFGLNYTRILGAHDQQRTAIEAAALAAARDLTSIVVEDPNCGFVSLSDVAPVGSGTIAGDNYYLSVKGINTLLATTRLDMIIADQFNDPVMQQLAQRDYDDALAAQDGLSKTLSAVVAGGTGIDANGKVVNPLQDALQAYKSNSVRMLGPNKCQLVENSLKLSLGCISNDESTTTPIPQPAQFAQMSDSGQSNGCYLPYVNAPYGSKNFVFCATAKDIHLVDGKKVQSLIGGLPYQLPSIVICQADEIYRYSDNHADVSTKIVHVRACAEPACVNDNVPAPGSLQLGFPEGKPSTMNSLQDLLVHPLNKAPADYVLTSRKDDSPPAVATPFTIMSGATQHPVFGVILHTAVYDWIRRARTKPNLQAIAGGISQNFQDTDPSSAHALNFDFVDNGSILITSVPISANTRYVISQDQYLGASGMALQEFVNTPQQTSYDLVIKDYTFVQGRTNGGRHAGEPFGSGGTVVPFSQPGWLFQNVTGMMQFPIGPAGGAVRPTYQTPGVAVEILMQKR